MSLPTNQKVADCRINDDGDDNLEISLITVICVVDDDGYFDKCLLTKSEMEKTKTDQRPLLDWTPHYGFICARHIWASWARLKHIVQCACHSGIQIDANFAHHSGL